MLFFFQSLERGIKLAFEEFHLWFQYGLGLICCGRVRPFILSTIPTLSLVQSDKEMATGSVRFITFWKNIVIKYVLGMKAVLNRSENFKLI